MAVWACKYNKDVQLKDPTKRPTVLYLTQENSIRETISRLFTYCTGESIRGYSTEDALKIVREEISAKTGVELSVKYRPNKQISTNDLYSIIEDLGLEGLECICLFQDYTKRIRSSANYPDLRLELGEVVNDLAVLAKTLNIPVVSAGQLNREAYRIMEASQANNRSNIAKDLNASHVGESALMVENTDYAIIINREKEESMDKDYLTFKLIASRDKNVSVSYFAHPFENGLRLEEDFELSSSLSLEKIGDNLDSFNPNNAKERVSSYQNANITASNRAASYSRNNDNKHPQSLDVNSSDIDF